MTNPFKIWAENGAVWENQPWLRAEGPQSRFNTVESQARGPALVPAHLVTMLPAVIWLTYVLGNGTEL